MDVNVAYEHDRCRRFEGGLRSKICTPIIDIVKRLDFSQLVKICPTCGIEHSRGEVGSGA